MLTSVGILAIGTPPIQRISSGPRVSTNTNVTLGDIELLEAATARSQIFSREGGSYSKVTAELYAGVLGGMLATSPKPRIQ